MLVIHLLPLSCLGKKEALKLVRKLATGSVRQSRRGKQMLPSGVPGSSPQAELPFAAVAPQSFHVAPLPRGDVKSDLQRDHKNILTTS